MTDKENGAVIIVSRNSKTDKMSKDVRNEAIKETMNIEPVMMGLVVGGKGLNVKRLRRIYGVNITLPANGGSQITIEGPSAKMVSAAKKDIAQNLFTKTSFFIESSYFYLVIGQEGEQNQMLQDAFNVRIDLNEDDGRVEITGTRCEEAKKAIESLIERLKIAYYPFQEEFLVPSHLIGLVCGKKGSNRRRIESAHNVHVYIPKAVAYDQLQRIFVKGPDAGKVSAAKQDILDKLETMILDLDESFIGMIIGPGGEKVRRIYEEYDVTIYCERKNQGGNGRRKVYIVGEKSRIQAAKDDIVSIITGRKNAG